MNDIEDRVSMNYLLYRKSPFVHIFCAVAWNVRAFQNCHIDTVA
jgi:hypothetical protein